VTSFQNLKTKTRSHSKPLFICPGKIRYLTLECAGKVNSKQ